MAWLIGAITGVEKEELKRRGWDVHELTPAQRKAMFGPSICRHICMVYVDNDLFKIMSGPDWEKGGA